MRLQREISFLGPISEGLDVDEWHIGAPSVLDDVVDVLKEIFDGAVQDDQEKVFRVDIRIRRDDGSIHEDEEPNEIGRHRVINMRGVPAWDYMRDRWVISGTSVMGEIIPELRRALAFYDGTNATVYLTVQIAIDQSYGFSDLEEFEPSEESATFAPLMQPESKVAWIVTDNSNNTYSQEPVKTKAKKGKK